MDIVIDGQEQRRYDAIGPGTIDWDAIPDDLAERLLAINAEFLGLQPACGGLIVDEEAAVME